MVRPGLLVALLVVLVPVCVMLLKPAPKAAPVTNTITVNTTDDPGTSAECSLRAAINNANDETFDSNSTCAAGTGTDTIIFSVSGTITLGSTLPAIENTLTLDGSGQTITVDGAGLCQVLLVNNGATLNLNNLTSFKGENNARNSTSMHASTPSLFRRLPVRELDPVLG
jgi:CSLREA domain-containing protein